VVDTGASEREAIRRLISELGAARGSRRATLEEVAWLRDFFGRHVLRSYVDDYIMAKFEKHVSEDEQWPDDTSPEEYLESLRDTILSPRGGIFLTDEFPGGTWTIYFTGPVRRGWRGRNSANLLLVIFNAERHVLVTGFQPDDHDDYVSSRSGFWLR
jgi:hypothetical protein